MRPFQGGYRYCWAWHHGASLILGRPVRWKCHSNQAYFKHARSLTVDFHQGEVGFLGYQGKQPALMCIDRPRAPGPSITVRSKCCVQRIALLAGVDFAGFDTGVVAEQVRLFIHKRVDLPINLLNASIVMWCEFASANPQLTIHDQPIGGCCNIISAFSIVSESTYALLNWPIGVTPRVEVRISVESPDSAVLCIKR
jgi:hypothetical protein